jgi:cytochrome c
MADLLAFLFERGYFSVSGDPQRGERLFSQKHCALCHGQSGSQAPDLRAIQDGLTVTRLASAVWEHGPTMLDQMRQRGVDWPSLTDRDVADLIAFFNRD